MKSRLPILLLLVVFAVGLAATAFFVMGGDGGGAQAPVASLGPDDPAGPAGPAQPGARTSGAAVRNAAATDPAADPAIAGSPTVLTDALELGPGEALLEAEVRALETDRALEGVTLLLVPEDERELATERTFAAVGGLGQAPRTDASGRARFVVPIDRTFHLRASARQGHSGPADTRVRALREGERSKVVLKVPTANDLAFFGVVQDASSGKPVSGARVLVRNQDVRRVRERVEDHSETLQTVRTDARGAFDVSVASWLNLHLRVEADGYAPAVVPIDRGASSAEDAARIRLKPAATLAVRVVDEKGAGLAGRTVQLRTEARVLLHQDGPAPPGTAEAGWSAATDDDGRVSFDDLPPEADLYLELHDRGELVLQEPVPLRIAPGARLERELLLRQGLSLRGRLVDRRGWPAARTELWMLSARAEGSAYIMRHDKPVAKTLTDSEGGFVFRDVPVGLWTVAPSPAYPPNVMREERFAPVGTTVRIENKATDAEERELVLEGDRGLYVAGRVAGAEGATLAGVRITCTAVEAGFVLVGASVEEGRFEFGPLTRGDYKLVAQPNGAAVAARVVAQAGDEDVTIQVGEGGVVHGTVVDAQGRPVAAELTIECTEDPDDPRLQRIETKDGAFRFANNAPGTYAVVARTSDGRIGLVRDLALEDGASLPPIQVAVAAGATVKVRWDGKPVPWMCTAELDGLLVSFATSEDGGTVELTVPTGTLKIGYASEALNDWGETFVDVAAGDTREVVFP